VDVLGRSSYAVWTILVTRQSGLQSSEAII